MRRVVLSSSLVLFVFVASSTGIKAQGVSAQIVAALQVFLTTPNNWTGTQTFNDIVINGTCTGAGCPGGGGGAPTNASYITKTVEAGLSAEFSLGTLTTGLLLNTVAAAVGTPSTYAGTTCAANTVAFSLNASAVVTCVTVDLSTALVVGDLPFSKLVQASAQSKLVGRGAGSAGDFEEITLGSNLTMTGTTLSAAGGSGAPGGLDQQVQFNDAGSFAGNAAFIFDKTSGLITTTGNLTNTTAGKILAYPRVSVTSGGLYVQDPSATAFTKYISGNVTADRTLTHEMHDANRTIDLAGNLTLAAGFTTSGANTITFTTTGATSVVLPTSGNLVSSSGTWVDTDFACVSGTSGKNLVDCGAKLSDFLSLAGIVQGDLIYGTGSNTITTLNKNTTATRYLSNTGTTNNPAWAAVDVSNGVTAIMAGANGGTGNGFFAVTGPAASLRTFTFPNASAVVLTDNAAVTVAQGGTGITSGTSGGVPYFSGATTIASSAALTANLPVIGGGAGVAPSVGTRQGNTTAFVTYAGSAPATNDCAKFDANGNVTTNGSACGGSGGTPGGSNTQVQFNDSSAFGGDSGLTFNKTTDLLTGVQVSWTGLTITTDADATVGAETVTATLSKNDANTRAFSIFKVNPLLSTGASNTTTTLNVVEINTQNTTMTGLTTNLVKAAYGSTTRFTLDSTGAATFTTNTSGSNSNLTLNNSTNGGSARLLITQAAQASITISSGASNTINESNGLGNNFQIQASNALRFDTGGGGGWFIQSSHHFEPQTDKEPNIGASGKRVLKYWGNTQDLDGLTMLTAADGTVGVSTLAFSVTKNDANTRQLYGQRITGTIAPGGSNTTTTLDIFNVNTVNTASTGMTTYLASFMSAGVRKVAITLAGNLDAVTYSVGGTNGATGTACSQITNGLCTTATVPLMSMDELITAVQTLQQENAELRQQMANLTTRLNLN